MTRRTAITAGFLTVTAVAVGWEIYAAQIPNDDFVPWTHLVTAYVPQEITMLAIVILIAWLGPHFVQAYEKRKQTTMTHTPTQPELPPVPAQEDAPKEPLLSVGTVTAIGAAILTAAIAYGLPLSENQEAATLTVLAAVAPIVLAIVGRGRVFSPNTVAKLVAAQRGGVPPVG